MAEPRVLQRMAAYPAFVACVSSACASAAKTGLPNSGTSRPIAPESGVRPGGT